jgi:hypothetical protein
MAKKKKTRDQKVLSDKKREAQVSSLYSFSQESLKQQDKIVSTPTKQTGVIHTTAYQHLSKDLLKTAAFTGFIIVAEIVLRYIIKN